MEVGREAIKKEGECKDDGDVSEKKFEKVEKAEKEEEEENEEKEEKKGCERKEDGGVKEEVLARYIVATWGISRMKLVCTAEFILNKFYYKIGEIYSIWSYSVSGQWG